MRRLLFLALLIQDEAVDAKIGEIDPHQVAGTTAFVYHAPTLDRAAVMYRLQGRTSYVLENKIEETRPIKWVGWKMPEAQSVLLAGTDNENRRRLLVEGVEREAWDAALADEGTALVFAERTGAGLVVKTREAEFGPFDDVELFSTRGAAPCFRSVKQGQSRLHIAGQEFELKGRPIQIIARPDGSAFAWVEALDNKKQRAVVNGVAGVECDAVQNGIHFSPNGKHAAYVTRDAQKFRAWIDGQPIASEVSVVMARVFDDGTTVLGEAWPEPGSARPPILRGRLVVNGKREDRVLSRPVLGLEWRQDRFLGVSRDDDKSVIVTIPQDGPIGYEEARGRVGEILFSPSGDRKIYTVLVKEGHMIDDGKKRVGPYDRVEFFHLEHTQRFGYVAVKDEKVWLAVGDKTIPVPVTEYFPPVRLSKTEMTAAIVGLQRVKDKKEIWVRVIPLE